MIKPSYISLRRNTSSKYDGLSKSELLDKFKTSDWPQSKSDRIAVLQALENKSADEQGRKAAKVIEEKNQGLSGSFTARKNVIKVDVSDKGYNNSYNSLHTYYHESRHAQQAQAVRNGEGLDDEMTRKACHVEDTAGNYDSASVNEDLYDQNTSEIDSNTYAAEKMLEQSERFKDDPMYSYQMDKIEWEMSNTNHMCEYYKPERMDRMIEKVEKSYSEKDITKQERDEMVEYYKSLKDDYKKNDVVVERSKIAQQSLKEYNETKGQQNSSEQLEQKNNLETTQKDLEKPTDEKREEFFNEGNASYKSSAENEQKRQEFFQKQSEKDFNNSNKSKRDNFFSDENAASEQAVNKNQENINKQSQTNANYM